MRLIAVIGGLTLVSLAVTAAEPRQLTVALDTRKTGQPISKYLYGQFIEHLGRCVYGGLWAEMLEDRKFYYPVTGEAPAWEMFVPGPSSWEGEGQPYELLVRSPWMVIGDRESVRMTTQAVYVGDHTPEVTLTRKRPVGGLLQGRLALEKDRAYVGRIVVAGDETVTRLEVSLVWGSEPSARDTITIEPLGSTYRKHQLLFTARGSTDKGRLEIVGRGHGRFRLGTVSLMPADNVHGWRADTLALLEELAAPIYRWPGGNFVSGYDWKDGVGERDRRPPRKNPAWKGLEHNDVGLHEYLDLCRLIEAEPLIAVNTGLGGADAAAEQVEYVNGSPQTAMGRLRAKHGHPQPFGVRWWAIGNEMYGDWQLGHMSLEDYLMKHQRVVEAMLAVDPHIQPIAVGNVGEWSREMLRSCADHMALISEHLYWQDRDDLLEHVQQVPAGIRRVAEAHRAYRRELPSLQGKDIRIALDEWNYWYGRFEFGELGTRFYLQDALGVAAGLHEMFRHSDLFFMANYAQTVNVIGAIKTTPTEAELEPTALVLMAYRRFFGVVPMAVFHNPVPLDVAAAWTEDRSAITLGVVNPTQDLWRLSLHVTGASTSDRVRRRVISGRGRWVGNAPGKPRGVDVAQSSATVADGGLEVPPLSVTLFELSVGQPSQGADPTSSRNTEVSSD